MKVDKWKQEMFDQESNSHAGIGLCSLGDGHFDKAFHGLYCPDPDSRGGSKKYNPQFWPNSDLHYSYVVDDRTLRVDLLLRSGQGSCCGQDVDESGSVRAARSSTGEFCLAGETEKKCRVAWKSRVLTTQL